MVKRFLVIVALSVGFVTGGLTGCAGAPEPRLPDPTGVDLLWRKSAGGLVTDLNGSADGSRLLVATVPFPDSDISVPNASDASEVSRGYQVSLLNADGESLWSRSLPDRIKTQALSPAGDFAVVRTYDGKLTSFQGDGTFLWSVDADCAPFILSSSLSVICVHDDDAVPGIAFDVYSKSGRKLLSRSVKGDLLSLKVGEGSGLIAVATTGGRLEGFGKDFRTSFKRKLRGEVVDLAISAGEKPRILILLTIAGEGQRVVVLDSHGKTLGDAKFHDRFEQVAISSDGQSFYLEGNGSVGQELVRLPELSRWKAKAPLQPLWSVREPIRADYLAPIETRGDRVIGGLETRERGNRVSRIQGWDPRGGVVWSVPAASEDGGYLFARSGSQDGTLSVATDTGELLRYRLEPKKTP